MDTQTTLALGHSSESLDVALNDLDEDPMCLLPLWKHLFLQPRIYPDDIEELCMHAFRWVDFRGCRETPTFEEVDPTLGGQARACFQHIMTREDLVKALTLEEEAVEKQNKKFHEAVKIMVAKQQEIFKKKGYPDPTKVDGYNVKIQNLEVWLTEKITDASTKLRQTQQKLDETNEFINSLVHSLVSQAFKQRQKEALAPDSKLLAELETLCLDDDEPTVSPQKKAAPTTNEPEKLMDEKKDPPAQNSLEGMTTAEDGQEAPVTSGPPGQEAPMTSGPPGQEAPMTSGPPGQEAPMTSGPAAEAPEAATNSGGVDGVASVDLKPAAGMEVAAVDSTPPTEPSSEPPAEVKTDGEQNTDAGALPDLTAQQKAFNQLQSLEDGPLKSALLNMCETMQSMKDRHASLNMSKNACMHVYNMHFKFISCACKWLVIQEAHTDGKLDLATAAQAALVRKDTSQLEAAVEIDYGAKYVQLNLRLLTCMHAKSRIPAAAAFSRLNMESVQLMLWLWGRRRRSCSTGLMASLRLGKPARADLGTMPKCASTGASKVICLQ